MRINLLPLLAVAAVTVGCTMFQGIEGSGTKKSESRSVKGFKAVRVEGSSDVDIKVGPKTSVVVTTDDNLLQYVTTTVEGDTLVISTRERVNTRSGLHVAITMPALNGVAISGSGDVNAEGIRTESFKASISGSGDVQVSGTATTLSASIAGSGDMNLRELEASDADASISGSGDISLRVARKLRASIAGSGDISYVGQPEVTKSLAGSGSVHPE